MAFINFKADVWALALQRKRDRLCVGVNLCDRSYENEVTDLGQSVKINWTKRPTIKNYVQGSMIDDAEILEGGSSVIQIDQQKYVHFMVDDVDEMQSRPNIMESCMNEAAAAIAEDADNYVYKLYNQAGSVITNNAVNSQNVVSVIADAARRLYENNVPMNEELYLEVSPAVYQKLWLAKALRFNANETSFENGYVGMVDNFKVYMTNGIVTTGEGAASVYHCIARTKKAVVFLGQLKKMEAYRPDKQFSDAVKGLHTYGAGVVRANEMVELALTVAAE